MELKPKWVTESVGGPIIGFTFLCPHCGEVRLPVWTGGGRNLGVMKARGPHIAGPTDERWKVTGKDFETISVFPSVDVRGHWHGMIENGETT